MKTIFTSSVLVAVGLLMTGCYSLVTASSETLSNTRVLGSSGKPKEHIVVSNYGWYLFNAYPIVCGNARKNASCPFVFFRDDVTSDILHGHLTAYAAEKKADVAELNLFFDDSVLLQISGYTIPIPIPYVISYRERTVSGLLMEPPAPLPAPQPSGVAASTPPPIDENRKREANRLLEKIPDGGVK